MGTSSYKYPVSCLGCGNAFEQTKIDTDDDFQTHYLPDACPRCGGKDLGPFDPATSQRKRGDKGLCGRCQGTKRNFGPSTVLVPNAPGSVHTSWCYTCVAEVNEGGQAVIPGVSIDREGFVTPGRPPVPQHARPPQKDQPEPTPTRTPEEKLASVTTALVVTACMEGIIAVLLIPGGLMVALTPKGSPGYDPNAPHPVVILAFCACALVRGFFLVRWAFAMRTRESHRTAVRAATLAAIPVGGCCLLSTPVGLWALLVLHEPGGADLFAKEPAEPPAVAPDDTAAEQTLAQEAPKISVACPNCGKRARVPRSFVGKKGKCKGCGRSFVLRETDEQQG